jgi:hypothetical protein
MGQADRIGVNGCRTWGRIVQRSYITESENQRLFGFGQG